MGPDDKRVIQMPALAKRFCANVSVVVRKIKLNNWQQLLQLSPHFQAIRLVMEISI
jgi:hypothetical protein